MSSVSRQISFGIRAVVCVAAAGWAGAVYADPVITLLESEASTILDTGQVTIGTDGTAAGTAVGPCLAGCIPTPVGSLAISYTSGNRNSQTTGSASTSIGGVGSAQASATLPTSSSPVAGGFELSDNSVTATELGTTGALAAAAAASWDTITFHGVTPGEMGTLSETLTLATPASPSTDVGTGGGCISFGGAVCNPFTNTITGKGASETLTETIALNEPLLVFSALYVVADNDDNIQTTSIDPDVILNLPAGVTFSTVSGNTGGSTGVTPPPGVPEPSTFALFGAAGLALAAWRRRRKLDAAA